MCSFIQDSLRPEIFWTALSALGTILAVLVALFFPTYQVYMRNNKIERLIELEIKNNYSIIKNMASESAVTLPPGITQTSYNYALAKNVKMNLWDEYRYKLASDRPESFERYAGINMHAEAIKNIDLQPEMIRQIYLQNEAKSFLEKYKKLKL